MKNENSPDSYSDSLERVLTLMVKAYMETLLKDESPPGGYSGSL